MDIPLELSFRDMASSPAVETLVREKVDKLDHFFGHLTSCRVTIGAPHRSKPHRSKTYHITVELGIPGRRDLVVSHETEENSGREDVYAAVRDAFDKAQRQLTDLSTQLEGKAKRHNPV